LIAAAAEILCMLPLNQTPCAVLNRLCCSGCDVLCCPACRVASSLCGCSSVSATLRSRPGCASPARCSTPTVSAGAVLAHHVQIQSAVFCTFTLQFSQLA
jgi:hypothetical protein